MFDLLISGFTVLLAPKMLFFVVLAVFLGTLFGALPGVSATMAVTLGIPFTYSMTAVQAIVFLVAIYCASITGGGMTAILFKIPGVPSSAPTTYDGYPMAQRGEAGKALGIQLVCSAVGGMVAAHDLRFPRAEQRHGDDSNHDRLFRRDRSLEADWKTRQAFRGG
ncbi:MAG: tripartite tricarboxylate transporter permease [Candidatus Accumulibacter sp.]|jgi:putative tricarboxylic transport membrane protein|nr:tripartite tricarboxylate transporter permease [Accumulibacter sp.]